MKIISGPEWVQNYAAAFQAVFRDIDPFDEPLADGMKSRLLLAPVYYTLSPEQFEAVCVAAGTVGDRQLCVSITEEFESGSGLTATHWIFESWEYAAYQAESSFGVLENAIYSPSGKWGILLSHEQHAVVGGSSEFISAFKQEYSNTYESVAEFLSYWSDVHQRTWDFC